MAYEDRQGWEPGTDDFERERNEGWERERGRGRGRMQGREAEEGRWGMSRPESRRYGSYEERGRSEGYRGSESYREPFRGEAYRGSEPYRSEESYRRPESYGGESYRPSESYRRAESFRGESSGFSGGGYYGGREGYQYGPGYRREFEGPDYYGPGQMGQRQFESGRMTGQAFGGPEYGGQGWASRSSGQEQRGRFTGRGPKGYHRSDERIEEEVNEALTRAGEIDAVNIEVKVQNGVVTLSGTVDDRQAKREAEDLIENLSGVKEVENRLRVTGGNGQTGQGGQTGRGNQQTGMQSGQSGQGGQNKEGRESESRGRTPARV